MRRPWLWIFFWWVVPNDEMCRTEPVMVYERIRRDDEQKPRCADVCLVVVQQIESEGASHFRPLWDKPSQVRELNQSLSHLHEGERKTQLHIYYRGSQCGVLAVPQRRREGLPRRSSAVSKTVGSASFRNLRNLNSLTIDEEISKK